MARSSRLDELKADVQHAPPGVEIVKPAAGLEEKLAREGMELNNRGMKEMLQGQQPGPRYPLIENPPKMVKAEVVPPTTPIVAKPVEQPKMPDPDFRPRTPAPFEHEVTQAAHILVRKLQSLSHVWEQKVEAMRAERRLSDDQICIALMAHTLDSDSHLVIPVDHPYFSESFEPAGRTVHCVECGELVETKYPGQPPVCILGGRGCGVKWNLREPSEQAELRQQAFGGNREQTSYPN